VEPFSLQFRRWFGSGIEKPARFGRRQELRLGPTSRTPLTRCTLARDDQNSLCLNRDPNALSHLIVTP
jgi:hypothetical protein